MPNSSTSNQSPSNPPPSSESIVVLEAALIATFYGPRKKGGIKRVREQLIDKLDLTPHDNRGEQWVNLSKEKEPILLRRINPPAAVDTRVVQLALNRVGEGVGEVKSGWVAMRQQLERILDNLVVSSTDDLQEIWGYSLIYQAALQGDTLPDTSHPALRELVDDAQRLHVTGVVNVPILAQTDIEGGRLWLTDVPLERDGVEAATVYVALVPTDKQNDLIEKVLFGANASLLMPDLIAHKGYQQRRQYRQGNSGKKYEQSAKDLLRTAGETLRVAQAGHNPHDIKQLQLDYKAFLPVLPIFRELRLSLARQEHNFQRWQARINGGDILDFHHEHLENALRELELLVMKGEDTQKAVETTLNLLQSNLEKREQERQQSLQNWLAIIGVAFAVPQLITPDVAERLLILMAIPKAGADYDTLLLLAVQFGITVLFAILTWIGMTIARRFT